jgi:hypothetical protein
MDHRPQPRESDVAWELRGAWASQREVVVTLDEARPGPKHDDAPPGRKSVRGYVEHVAPTDAFALMWDGRSVAHIPLARVMGVLRTHMDSRGRKVKPREREPIVLLSGQMSFDFTV